MAACWAKNKRSEVKSMDKYVCPCGYVYDPAVGDPDNGVAPGTAWEEIGRASCRERVY